MQYIYRLSILKNIFWVLVFSFLIGCNTHAIKNENSNELQQIIRTQVHPYVMEYIEYADKRELHREDTKVVSELLRTCFEHRFAIRRDNKDKLRHKALNLYYKYKIEPGDDWDNIYMTALNRSAVFASLSLVSDKVRQHIFIDDADKSLEYPRPDIPLHHMFYWLLKWIYSIEEKDKDAIKNSYNTLYNMSSEWDFPKAFYDIVFVIYHHCENKGLFISNTEPLIRKNITDRFDK